MGYDRYQDRGQDRGRPASFRDERPRSAQGRDPRTDDSGFAYSPPRDYRTQQDDDRGFFERAGDEVRSWFGDDDAERRRERDNREDYRGDRSRTGYGRDDNRRDFGRGGTGYGNYGNYNDAARATGRDPGYHDWRRRQIDALDRDYDEYAREHQSKFDDHFGSWRTGRETQRSSLGRVAEHMDVVGSDGEHIGAVDHVRGDRILLTKTDKDAGGHHHSIPSKWIQSVDDKVTIAKTAVEAHAAWKDEERGAMFGNDRNRDGATGPHLLNRSFSGTY